MDQLSGFLKKYKRLLSDDESLKKTIIEVLKECSIPNVTGSSIKLQGNNLYLQVKPVLKSEIFLRKQKILEILNSKQDQYKFKDIKF